MRITRGNLRSIIREMVLKESIVDPQAHDLVKAHIARQLGPARTKISTLEIEGFNPSNFQTLMEEIALVESGYVDGGKIIHSNEKEGDIKGVFQISPVALDQLKIQTTVPKTRANFDSSNATVDPWAEQPYGDIYNSVAMQAAAASMYALYLYFELAGKPDISTLDGRAKFWATHYNSLADEKGTPQYYKRKLSEIDAAVKSAN